ncbi:ImmA/IrrE family metallo-endopeptidase [Lysinibacillus odysseyi]|uniref:Membrane protein n=1 Tax=Lysinibacillus odysseyi 34hs-1 = NBRC 100172 TaxID=1220589 RepID=A0A0A3J8Z5_9BACI|nr:ImmA/IrrE family metallo-endopeptidase [Lysinibacillus odysseyi]KGR83512.1 membrane protein [Lysinibacillus odysseyi 34hs-1 = NBRC 100172]
MIYEQLTVEASLNNIEIYEKYMPSRLKGLYGNNIIWINKHMLTRTEKACVLAEELGHHHTSVGDILDQSNIENRKQELRARRWAFERLIPFSKIVQAHRLHISNRYELADFLGVTEDFLQAALDWYKSKYGLCVVIEQYTIYFEPLGVLEMFDWIEKPSFEAV